MKAIIWRPTTENILIESWADLLREPTDESRYEVKKPAWDYVIEEIGQALDRLIKGG